MGKGRSVLCLTVIEVPPEDEALLLVARGAGVVSVRAGGTQVGRLDRSFPSLEARQGEL